MVKIYIFIKFLSISAAISEPSGVTAAYTDNWNTVCGRRKGGVVCGSGKKFPIYVVNPSSLGSSGQL